MLFDPGKPNIARVYDALLGGKDSYAADREAAWRITQIEPGAPVIARENRAFLGRAVRYLAGEAGIRQFLDIGSGLPAVDNVHEAAQSVAPDSRVVYVDNDPVVLAHALALLTSASLDGACAYVDSDLRDTGTVIAEAARTLDFSEPVAVLLFAIIHFIPDSDDPYGIVRRLMAAVPPGSYLVMSHASSGGMTGVQRKGLNEVYSGTVSGGVTQRSPQAIAGFFDGLELVSPGIAGISAWRPGAEGKPSSQDLALFCGGAGRKR
jgi:hypothetical protein